jgi:hypothetical protein
MSAVKFLDKPPTVMVMLRIDGDLSRATTLNHEALSELGIASRTLHVVSGGRVSVIWLADAVPSVTPRQGNVVRCVAPLTKVSSKEYTVPLARVGRPPGGRQTSITSLALKFTVQDEAMATPVAVATLYTSSDAFIT